MPSSPSSPDSCGLLDLWDSGGGELPIKPAPLSPTSFDSEDTEAEDVHESDRKRFKCLGWWEREEFMTAVSSLLYKRYGLLNETWLDIECFLQQDYQSSMESAIQHILNFIRPELRGRPFMIGITADIYHRWYREDKDKKGNWIGYHRRGFRKMYIVHVSNIGKADSSIELFEKDPERKQQLIYRDTSAGRMEMNLCKDDGTGLKHMENCLNEGTGNEAATNRNGPQVVYIVIK